MSPHRSGFLLDPPPGFRGLDPNLPITIYTRHLPHWRQEGATYFVSFHLADSLPKEKRDELRSLRAMWRRRIEEMSRGGRLSAEQERREWEALSRTTLAKTERWLDAGHGSCVFRDPGAREVATALVSDDGMAYQLGAFAVMPNHVHAVLKPHEGCRLEQILQKLKSRVGRLVNRMKQTSGSLWEQESYDRIVRDAEHLWRCLQYIGKNPPKAGLSDKECSLWIRPEWRDAGWDFADQR